MAPGLPRLAGIRQGAVFTMPFRQSLIWALFRSFYGPVKIITRRALKLEKILSILFIVTIQKTCKSILSATAMAQMLAF